MSKVVLITGSSSGIGLTTAKAFKDRGYTVYASARRAEFVEMLQKQGLESLQLDVTDEKSLMSAVQYIESRHHSIDILVNNAGYSLPGPMEELEISELRTVFETNVFGMLRLSQLVLPNMRRNKWGRIINLGSVGGTFTTPGSTAYHMTKWAVESLSDGLRAEVKGFGVDVVLIQPGGVATDFVYSANLKIAPNRANSPYKAFRTNIIKNSEGMFEGNSSRWGILKPEQVANAIIRASEARKPHTRYKVGMLARILPLVLGFMSDRQADNLWLRQFPMT